MLLKTNTFICIVVLWLVAGITYVPAQSHKFKGPVDLGKVDAKIIDEASGLAASRKNRNVLWVHNDDSSEAKVFAINTKGKVIASYRLDIPHGRDWEDIAVGPGPEEGFDYIYLGDIGDNLKQYDLKYVYRFKEPEVKENQKLKIDTIKVFDKIAFKLPTKMIYDTEALMLDPKTKDMYVITKRLKKEQVYRIPFPQTISKTNVAEFICELPYGYEGFNGSGVTAGDISPDGSEILIKTYAKVYYYKREKGESIKDALSKKPIRIKYEMEPQGEGLSWQPQVLGYYTISEVSQFDIPPHLYYYRRVPEKDKKKKKR